jgi:hypothetical protein
MRTKIVLAIAAACTVTLIGAVPAVADSTAIQVLDHQAFVEPSIQISPAVEKAPGSNETAGQRNARKKAADYLSYTAFSRSGLIEQLEYEGFSTADATYGADSVNADWNEQAVEKAKDYLEYTAFSRSGLIEQLEYEGFTSGQAEFGVNGAGL